jgi:hypothetical protein
MSVNTDSTKSTPADVRFAVTITESGQSYGLTQYRHFTARAYILARDKYSAGHRMELHSCDSYGVDAGKARALAGLVITAQADDSTMTRPGAEWYGWSVSYDRSRVELRDAGEILPVLRKIQRRQDKLTSELGRPATLAQFCAYAVSAITAQRNVFVRSVPDSQDWEGNGGYRSMDADALSYHLQSDATEYRKNHGIDVAS